MSLNLILSKNEKVEIKSIL